MITVHVPTEIDHYAPELRFFMDCMVQKLMINRHKGFADNTSVTDLLENLMSEVIEADQAHALEGQFEFFMECVDIANMAWLAGLSALRMTKADWQANRVDEMKLETTL